MSRHSRRYFLLLFAVLALGYFFYKFRHSITLEGFHWRMVGSSLLDARWELLLLSIAGVYACYALRALRWMQFCRTLGPTRFRNVYSGTLMGFACVFLLGRAGEPIRPVIIARKDSLSVPGMFGVYFLERIFDIASAVVLAGYALLKFKEVDVAEAGHIHLMALARSAGVLLLGGLILVIIFLIYFRYHGAGWLARRLKEPRWHAGWRAKVAVLLEGFSEGLQAIRTWGDLGILIFYTVIHWLLVALVYLWVSHAFGGKLAEVDFSGAVLVLAFTLIGSAAQLPGVGGGAQLATFLVFTLVFGVEKEPAATAAVVLWLVTFAAGSLVGLPLLFREGWTMGELKRIAKSEEKAEEASLLATAEHRQERGENPR
jgi:glycosyltransferase 2 family protein